MRKCTNAHHATWKRAAMSSGMSIARGRSPGRRRTQMTRQAADRHLLAVLSQHRAVANRLPRLLHHFQVDVELILEAQRFPELEGRGHARPSDLGIARGNAQARRAPHRVLGFLDVLEEVGEVHDAGRVGFRKLDLPVVGVLADGAPSFSAISRQR